MSNLQQLAGPLPLIDIDSVRMERETFQARFVIKTEEALDVEPFWLNEDLFSEFIRFWFIVSIKSIPQGIFDRSTPAKGLDVAKYVSPITRARLNNYPEQMMVEGTRGVAYESYSLKDLKERFKVDSDTQSSLGLQTLNKNEILFEIEFSLRDMNQGDKGLFTNFSDNEIGQVELITFSHLDVKEMESQFGVTANLYSSLTEIGGNLVRLPLIRRSQVGLYSQLEIATPIQSLFDSETGALYEGEYHYHSADPPVPNNTDPTMGPLGPGPNGYVGYMSGPPGHPMGDARILTVRSVPNDKVTANFLTPDDAPWGLDWSSESYYQMDFIGGTPPSYRSSLVQDPSVNEPSQLSKIQKSDLLLKAIESRTKKNAFSDVHTSTGLVANKLSQVTTFTVDINEVLKKSPYYGIYERLVGSKNVKSVYERLGPELNQVLQSAFVVAGYSTNIGSDASSIIRFFNSGFRHGTSTFHQVRIYRRRLQNQPNSNNVLSTKTREKRSFEDMDELISLGSMTRLEFPGPYSLYFEPLRRGVIVETLSRDRAVKTRELTLRVHDAELMSTINYGIYTYVVELDLFDFTKTFIKRFVDRFQQKILYVQGFLHNYASLKENYTESIDRYKAVFRSSTQFEEFADEANDLIELYVLLNSIMFYSENNNITKPFVEDIQKRMTSTRPGRASLKRSYEFLDKCVQLESVYRDFLAKNRDSALASQNASQLSTDTMMFSAKTSGVRRTDSLFYTSFSQQLPSEFFVEAITDGQLMLDIGLESFFNINTTAPTAGDLQIAPAITTANELTGAGAASRAAAATRGVPVQFSIIDESGGDY